MEIDPQTGGIVAAVVAAVGLLGRLGWRRFKPWLVEELSVVIGAAVERYRIREAKREAKRSCPNCSPPPAQLPVPEFVGEETTDIHELIELERGERAKRKTDRQERARPRGERAPRPGTHHDREE